MPHAPPSVHVFVNRPRYIPDGRNGTPEAETESHRAIGDRGDKRAGEDERIPRGRVCGCRSEKRGKRMNDELVEAEIAAMALIDAKRGDADAQYFVGTALIDGQDGFKRNGREAIAWFRRAAAQGNADALYVLACLHEVGDGVRQDPVEARRLFTLAAAHGHVQALLEMDVGNAPHHH